MMGSLKWPKASRCGAGRRLSLTRVTDEDKDGRRTRDGCRDTTYEVLSVGRGPAAPPAAPPPRRAPSTGVGADRAASQAPGLRAEPAGCGAMAVWGGASADARAGRPLVEP